MRSLVYVIVMTMACAAPLVSVSSAAACSCVSQAIYRSDPADGALDVPLNQALMVEGVFLPSTVKLENERGEAVPFELNAGPWPGCEGTSADVIPRTPLQPNARYVLRVDALYPDAEGPPQPSATIYFTTGTTTLPETSLAPPSLIATVVHGAPTPLCGSGSVLACISTPDTSGLELVMRSGQEVLLRTTTLVQDDALYSLLKVPDCIELRRRSPTGKRSAPRTICGTALKDRAWTAPDSPQHFVSCHNGVIGASAPTTSDGGAEVDAGSPRNTSTPSAAPATANNEEGCKLAVRSADSPWSALLLAATTGFLATRRRRPSP